MSYMRGPCYVWRDDERVHVWAEEGYDGWDDTSWAEGRTGSHVPGSMTDGASGIGLRQEIADAYVMMRLAELVCEQRISAVVESAVANFGGNGGCLALERLAATLVKNTPLRFRSRRFVRKELAARGTLIVREPFRLVGHGRRIVSAAFTRSQAC